ncbi:MAG: sigma 54-interacting transcriptional regulator [Rheinheimera sp.]|nr:sigma 54-interacting transcriptional regulator [Rheinheimera sp.]
MMVLGPSGSGKEVLARYIHQQSPRHEGHIRLRLTVRQFQKKYVGINAIWL